MNRKLFFDRIRQAPFKGRMTESQVRGTSAVLDAMGGLPTRFVAYALATTFAEVGRTMLPVREGYKETDRGSRAYVKSRHWTTKDGSPGYGRPAGPHGQVYYGRGLVQLTWLRNYAKASKKLGVDFVADPDQALEPDLAALIMRHGMTEGWFTGKKLSDYLSDTKTDYRNARRIINGTDKADMIAGYAHAFEAALRAAGYGAAEKRREAQEAEPWPGLPRPEANITPPISDDERAAYEARNSSTPAAQDGIEPKDIDAIIRQGTAAAAGVSAWAALFAGADRWIVLGLIGAGTIIALYALYVRAWRK